MEQNDNSTDIYSALTGIEQKYRNEKGAGVIIQNMPDDLTTELNDIIPHNHVCDVIVLTANCRPSVISVLSNDCDKAAAEQYVGTLACLLKRLCLLTYRHWCDRSTHLCFQRRLYYIGSGFDLEDDKVYYPEEYLLPTSGTLDIVRCTLAALLLHCEPMTDRFGDIMVRHLSSIQAKILLEERSKVTVVEGKAGSGKSVLALEAMRRIKQHKKDQSKILFLCRGRGLAAFVKYQTEKMGICIDIRSVQPDTMSEVTEDFSQYTDVFIDDAHALPMTGESNWQDMYHSLFSSLWERDSHCYILLDPDMQDYRGCIPVNFSKDIQGMTREYRFIRRQDVKTKILGKILRNSSRICQFIEANLGDKIEELKNIRNLPEDGVYLYIIEDLSKTKEILLPHKGGEGQQFEKGSHHRMYVAPFSCGDMINGLQHKTYNKGDLDAAAITTLEKLKLLLRAALKGSVYEEHKEEDYSEDEEKENGHGERDDENPNEEEEDDRAIPFSCRAMANMLQRNMDHKDDLDSAAVKKVKTPKLLLHTALKGSVHEEHGEGNCNDEEEEAKCDSEKVDGNVQHEGTGDGEEEDNNPDENGTADKGDVLAAARETLQKVKLPLPTALEFTVYNEHGEYSSDDDKDDDDDIDDDNDYNAEYVTLLSRLRDVLKGTLYQERHVTILTENKTEKILVKEIIACSSYHVQEATNFPVKHIVVDTLENFEGLESPVILFIVPESWGMGYVGSLKYRLCIATRAISRLEFLIPWNPTGREHDLAELRRAFRTEVN